MFQQMSKGMGGHQSTVHQKDEWITPPEIIDALGLFDLDPCAAILQPWSTAKTNYTIEDDGLKQEWHGRVWLNPPYGDETGIWLRKLVDHRNGIALIFARTETNMFFDHVWGHADALLFIRGRLTFYELIHDQLTLDGSPPVKLAGANSGAPSVLIAYGKNNAEHLRDCGIDGKFIKL